MEPYYIDLNDECEKFDQLDLIEYSYNDVFSVSDHLILILKDQMFEGDVIAAAKHRIELVNTREHGNSNKLGGIYFFYRNEINEIRRIRPVLEKVKPKEDNTQCALEIQMCEEEYHRYKEMSANYVFITKCNKIYEEAISRLNYAQTIGFTALGVEEDTGIGLLVMSTWDKVYLFDVASLDRKTFYPEIKQILSNELICKVFHRGGPQIRVLNKIYNVHVKNVSDTEVLDLVIEKNKAGSTALKNAKNISECLVKYFNFPSTCLQEALNTKNFKWFVRPLSDRRMLYAAQLATYLIMLHEKLEQIMFSEVQKATYSVCDYFYNLNDYEFGAQFNMNKVSEDVDELIPILTRHGIDLNAKVETKKSSTDTADISLSLMENLRLNHLTELSEMHRRRDYLVLKNKGENKKTKEGIPISKEQKKFDLDRNEAILMEWGYRS